MSYGSDAIKVMNATLIDYGIDVKQDSAYQEYLRRQNGKVYTLSDYVRSMIIAQLCANRPNKPIYDNMPRLREIFYDWDVDTICNTQAEVFISAITNISCGNRALRRQMYDLHYNISTLKAVDEKYGLNKYTDGGEPWKTAWSFASGSCKIKGFGQQLALQFLREVGVDCVKPDVHVQRILNRLGIHSGESDPLKDAYNSIDNLSKELGLPMTLINAIIWHYGAVDYVEICSTITRCDKCKVVGCPSRRQECE